MKPQTLFDWEPSPKYPSAPGFKERKGTSRDAARKIAPRAATLRDDCLRVLTEVWPAGHTADEVATILGKTVLAIRPRFSELNASKEIMKTTVRRKNESGVDAVVWVSRRPE